MSTITIQTATPEFGWRYGGDTASLRVYANQTFITSDGDIIQQGTYKEIECTVAGTALTIPSFELDSTTNSNNPYATYSATFYDYRGRKRQSWLSQFRLDYDTLGASTSWEMVFDYNTVQPPNFFNYPQIVEIISNMVTDRLLPVIDASAANKGKTRLTYDPVLASQPIAVGANDPEYLSALESRYMEEFSSLANAISEIGSTPTRLIIADSVNTTTDTLPENIAPIFVGNGAFNVTSGTLTIENGLGLSAPPDRQIFTGNGTVYFSQSLPQWIYPEWFGAVGDGTTDDIDAFTAINTIRPINTALAVWLSNGKNYKISAPWEIDNVTQVESSSSAWGGKITAAANSTAIIVHHIATRNGVNDGRTASFSVFKNFRMIGNNNSSTVIPTHTVNVSGTTVTKTSGANFSEDDGYIEGNTATIGAYTYAIDSRTNNSVLEIKPLALVVGAINGSAVLSQGTFGTWDTSGLWDGQDLEIDGDTYTIDTVTDATHITLTTNFTGTTGGYTGFLQGLVPTNGLSMRVNLSHGFDLRAPCQIEGCYVTNFPGNAYSAGGASTQGIPGTTPNQNNTLLLRNAAYTNYGSGFFSQGTNSNQINVINNDFTDNRGYGVWEHGFLGNVYFANHTSFNYQGATDSALNAVNLSTFVGEYAESAQPPSVFGQNNLVLGGNHGSGFAPNVTFPYMEGGNELINVFNLRAAQAVDATNTKAWMSGLGCSNLANVLLTFGAAEEAANLSAGYGTDDARYPAFQLFYNDLADGWYSLNFKDTAIGTPGTVTWAVSGSEAAEGGGLFWLPNGLLAGTSAARRKITFVDAKPTTGTVALSDTFFNVGADATEPVGWVCTTAGTLGSGAVVTPFGATGLESISGTAGKIPTYAAGASGGLKLADASETGSGAVVRATSPTLTTPTITNPTVSTGTFTSPALVTPSIGVASGTSLTASGLVKSSGTAGVGYATGAGSTITQSTDKSTGVTIDKICGAITMNNASLNDATNVSFTVTNSTVAATDNVNVNHSSGGTAGAYQVSANAISAGSFKVTVRNVSGGVLGEAIVLTFAVIKAVTS